MTAKMEGKSSFMPNPQSPVPNPQSPVPNPQSPIPNPQSPIPKIVSLQTGTHNLPLIQVLPIKLFR
ncbi:hypothetical protein H6G36_10040 [Anabaena minutissima FACHB-250]|nr:hypothetical protein [Anabaena minutissima FACHB-250]